MKQLLVIGVVAAILMPALPAMAEDQGATTVPPPSAVTTQVPAQAPTAAIPAKQVKEVELQDLTLAGTIGREEVQKRGVAVTRYFLTDASGAKIALPTPHASRKAPVVTEAVKLDDYVDARVKLSAKGTETVGKKGGKTTFYVHTITSIEKIPQP